MRSTIICAAMLSVLAIPATAMAQAVAVKTGTIVTSADGKRIGRVYDIDKASDGSTKAVVIIRDSKIIRISASTLTANDKGLATSLSLSEATK